MLMSVSVDVRPGVVEVHQALSCDSGPRQTRIAIQAELAEALASLAEARLTAWPSIAAIPAGQLERLEEDFQRGLSPIHEVREDWHLECR